MRKQITPSGTKLWLSSKDTYDWANKAGASWPCSQLSDRRVFVEFDRSGDLVDFVIDGGKGEQDCDSHELNAITSDALNGKV
jgi:hypothetical protein